MILFVLRIVATCPLLSILAQLKINAQNALPSCVGFRLSTIIIFLFEYTFILYIFCIIEQKIFLFIIGMESLFRYHFEAKSNVEQDFNDCIHNFKN
jgi:hypothetical protein